MTKRDEILNHTVEFLKTQGATSKENGKTTTVILESIKRINPEMNHNTVGAYLSALAKDPTSGIVLAGKGRGYYYVKPEQGLIQISESPTKQEAKKRVEREKKLYPIVRQWLLEKSYRVKDTSSARGNDKWGNPDITGLKVIDTVSETKEVELVTVEVKNSFEDWREVIFEAISHTRFANQVYFCFAYSEDYRRKIETEMFFYAEEFGIGILGIEMSDEDYQKFIQDGVVPNYDNIDMVELQTPPFKLLRPYFREKFFKTLGVGKLSDLYGFGEVLEDIDELAS